MKTRPMLATIVFVATTSVGAVIASPAHAGNISCTFSESTHTVTVDVPGDSASASIARDGEFIEVNGFGCFSPLFVAARVDTTDLVTVVGGAGDQAVTIGALRPGFTDEPGGSDEIEFQVTLGDGAGDVLSVGGTIKNDRFRFGIRASGPRINLNAKETAGIDADASTSGVEVHFAGGGQGNDVLSGVGRKGTGGEAAYPLLFAGATGDDSLTGGSVADSLNDAKQFPTEVQNDTDTLRGRGGADTLTTFDDDGFDSLFGGAGPDTCSVDTGDQVDSC